MKTLLQVLALSAVVPLSSALSISPTLGQIVPDNRLPGEASMVQGDCATRHCFIRGGAARGGNLFHSFDRFRLGEGYRAQFEHSAQIQRIFSRVTGGSASEIDGILSTDGASFFLLSPGGILFGPQAQLEVGASFLGTSASGIEWEGLLPGSFGTSASEAEILVDGLPQKLRFETGGGEIALRGDGSNLDFNPKAGDYLMLIGGEVSIEERLLTLPSQQLILGGFTTDQEIGFFLRPDGLFSLSGATGSSELKNVTLSRTQLLASDAAPNGQVWIQAKKLLLEESRISTLTTQRTGAAGDIRLSLVEGEMELREGSLLATQALPGTEAGDIYTSVPANLPGLKTFRMSQSQILTRSDKGGGNIRFLDASGDIQVEQASEIAALVQPTEGARAGEITISTQKTIEIRGESQVRTQTFSSGGNIALTSFREDIQLAQESRLQAESSSGGRAAGNISLIAAQDLELDRSSILTQTSATGGNLSIAAGNDVALSDRSLIQTETVQPKAGSITIAAERLLAMEGEEGGEEREGDSLPRDSDIIVLAPQQESDLFASNLSLEVSDRRDFQSTQQAELGNGRSEVGFSFQPAPERLPEKSPERLPEPLSVSKAATTVPITTAPLRVPKDIHEREAAENTAKNDVPALPAAEPLIFLTPEFLAPEPTTAPTETAALVGPQEPQAVKQPAETVLTETAIAEAVVVPRRESDSTQISLVPIRRDRLSTSCRSGRLMVGRSGLTLSGRGGVPPLIGARDRRSLLDLGESEGEQARAEAAEPSADLHLPVPRPSPELSPVSAGLFPGLSPSRARPQMGLRKEAKGWLRNRRGEIRLVGENTLVRHRGACEGGQHSR